MEASLRLGCGHLLRGKVTEGEDGRLTMELLEPMPAECPECGQYPRFVRWLVGPVETSKSRRVDIVPTPPSRVRDRG
jgi:hypothetical protein